MRLGLLLAWISAFAISARGADVCEPKDLQGAYGFQLTGQTTISGTPQPSVTLGSLVFDGEGGVSGTSSVKFAGLLLGNPVTGMYEAHKDCSVSWSLQDDSGAYQHFSGIAAPDTRRVKFSQTDPGGPQGGLLVRVAAQECKVSDLLPKYAFTLSGTIIPMTDGGSPNTVAAKGVMEENSHGHFQLTLEGTPPHTTDVSIAIESDCTVEMGFTLPAQGDAAAPPVNLRGILVDDYKQILAIQTDPGAVASARFTTQAPTTTPHMAPAPLPAP